MYIRIASQYIHFSQPAIKKRMSEFESAQGKTLQYFLVKHGDRVIVEAIAADKVAGRKKSGDELIGEGYDTQQMADAALDAYLGDR